MKLLEGQFRGATAMMAWLIVPALISWLLVRMHVLLALGPLFCWFLVVYPHDDIVHRGLHGFTPLFSSGMSVLIAVLQWSLVTVVYSLVTRRFRPERHLWAAPLVIVFVSAVTHYLVFLYGYEISMDWL